MKTSVFTVHLEELCGGRTWETYADLLPSGYETDAELLERVDEAIAMLPLRMGDMVDLSRRGHSQVQIAKMLGYTQANVSFMLKRARKILQMILSLPRVTEDRIMDELAELFDGQELALLRYFFRTSSHTHTLLLLGFDLARARHRSGKIRGYIDRFIGRMGEADADRYADFIEVFRFLQSHINVWSDIRMNTTPESISIRDVAAIEIIGLKRLKPLVDDQERKRLALQAWKKRNPEKVRAYRQKEIEKRRKWAELATSK